MPWSKSPWTIPQAEQAVRQLGDTLLAVNQRHERLIDGLRTLASSEQGITDLNPVDVADIARHITNELRGVAHDAGVDIRIDLRPAPVNGDPVLLERLTQNLLDNAIRYNLNEHGEITVTTDTADDDAHLTVTNTGPAIAPYEVPSLFEPFRRRPTTERLADPSQASTSRGAGPDCPSCDQSPTPTAATSTPPPERAVASSSRYG